MAWVSIFEKGQAMLQLEGNMIELNSFDIFMLLWISCKRKLIEWWIWSWKLIELMDSLCLTFKLLYSGLL